MHYIVNYVVFYGYYELFVDQIGQKCLVDVGILNNGKDLYIIACYFMKITAYFAGCMGLVLLIQVKK